MALILFVQNKILMYQELEKVLIKGYFHELEMMNGLSEKHMRKWFHGIWHILK